MTTDTRVKMASRTLLAHGTEITIAAFCKGSGMIAPQLATMIAAITTDAAIALPALQQALAAAADVSVSPARRRRRHVDERLRVRPRERRRRQPRDRSGRRRVRRARDRAAQPVRGARARDRVRRRGRDEAHRGPRDAGADRGDRGGSRARSIAGSSLVKAAIFGADPNWGRILATVGARVGSCGYPVNPYKASVAIQRIAVYAGAPVEHDKQVLKARMREPDVAIDVACAAGESSAIAWGCDLSYDYVKINADYSSLIVERAEGGLGKDDRLTNYSPGFKMSLLVEALGYIARFKGKRCVIKYGGAAMTKDTLKRSFCEDILLLRSVGLVPIVVHGGGPDITRALERLGSVPQFIDGQRVTDAADLKVVEMVLTGQVNSELVTLLNRARRARGRPVRARTPRCLRAKKLVPRRRPRPRPGRRAGVGQRVARRADAVARLRAGDLAGRPRRGRRELEPQRGRRRGGRRGGAQGEQADLSVRCRRHPRRAGRADQRAGRARSSHRRPFSGGMAVKTESILRALDGGVEAVHVIDGRTPHSVIAELFTDRGVGTVVRATDKA